MKDELYYKQYLESFKFHLKQRCLRIIERIFSKRVKDSKQIPIIINNYNRLTFPQALIDGLVLRGYTHIYIIDNASTYPPLLDYYKSIPYPVFMLKENIGFLAFRKSEIYKRFRNQYFVYTDSDVVLQSSCPDSFMAFFLHLLKKYPYISKVGFALKIDDLPDSFDKKDEVIKWESQFWTKEIEQEVYDAPIDTTFALHRPNVKVGFSFTKKNLRVGGVYTALHMPWYNNSSNLSEEEKFYINSVSTSTHWTALSKQ